MSLWYHKYKEIINYLIIGGATTVISIVSYYVLRIFLDNYQVCTILAWIISVSFAYITNRTLVFQSKNKKIASEMSKFFSSRLTTLLIEIISMYCLVEILFFHDKIAKLIVQIMIIILNYILSKKMVFRKEEKNEKE